MNASSRTRAAGPALLLALLLAVAVLLGMAGGASAGPKGKADPPKSGKANCATGRTIPASKISIQLWTFNRYINLGEGATPAGAPGPSATPAQRLEYVLAFLADVGYRKIEPYSFHTLTAEQFDALAEKYGLKVPSRHMSTNEAQWPANLAEAKLLGQRWTGSGGFASPGTMTYEDTLATAATMNRLGRLSKQNGTGKIFGHNHDGEFLRKFVDAQGDGTLKSAWQILVENTDPRWVTFQLDVGWATIAGEDAVAIVEQWGKRIRLLHVKDVADIAARRQTIVGQGVVDWPALFDAAQGRVKLYVIEQDPPPAPERLTWSPFTFAAESFRYVDCVRF
jgi:sugar phosphate isomerase/epimerase